MAWEKAVPFHRFVTAVHDRVAACVDGVTLEESPAAAMWRANGFAVGVRHVAIDAITLWIGFDGELRKGVQARHELTAATIDATAESIIGLFTKPDDAR